MKIKDLLPFQRPREKAVRYGLDALSDEEILAILIGSGYKDVSALDLASKLLVKHNGLIGLFRLTSVEQLQIKGISKVKALTILASINLLKRIEKNRINIEYLYNSVDIVSKYLINFSSASKEMLLLVTLTRKKQILKEQILYIGTKVGFDIDLDEVIGKINHEEVRSFVLVHNHPSGNIYPSKEDVVTTNELIKRAKLINVSLDDHIIIANYSYFSFKENGIINI